VRRTSRRRGRRKDRERKEKAVIDAFRILPWLVTVLALRRKT
jgi:hypothetical protein